MCRRFADRDIDRFAGVDCRPGPCGTLLLAGALATFICRHRSVRSLGDHVVFVVEVVAYGTAPGAPLVFHAGGFGEGMASIDPVG